MTSAWPANDPPDHRRCAALSPASNLNPSPLGEEGGAAQRRKGEGTALTITPRQNPPPFVLSWSKHRAFPTQGKRRHFDKLSANG